MDPRVDLDERSLRRYDWIDGVGVELANGQQWLIPSLPLEFRWPRRRWFRRLREVEVGAFSEDLLICERIIQRAKRDPDWDMPLEEMMRLCFHALRINYRIEPETATGLFDLRKCFRPIIEALMGISGWTALAGSGPGGDGSAPAADPSTSIPAA